MPPFHFIHLSDPHLVPAGERLCGLDPAERLRAAIADIARRHGPQGVLPAALAVVTGDLADRGDAASYALLREILAGLPLPAHLLLGNHDDRTVFSAAFPEAPLDAHGFAQQALDTPAGRLLLLDTLEPGMDEGRLCARRLEWLAAGLAAAPEAPVFLFLHHPPLPVGLPGLDGIALRDAGALWEVIAPHRARIRHLFHGHLHRPIAGSWHGIPLSAPPGTNHQVTLDFAPRPAMPFCHEPPAYALVRATEEGVVVHSHDFLDRTAGRPL